MNFLEDLKEWCESRIFSSGEACYEDGEVIKLQITNELKKYDDDIEGFDFLDDISLLSDNAFIKKVHGTIAGSRRATYNTYIEVDLKEISDFFCDCSYYEKYGYVCQHVVAVAFATFFEINPKDTPYKGYQKKLFNNANKTIISTVDNIEKHNKNSKDKESSNLYFSDYIKEMANALNNSEENIEIINSLATQKKNHLSLNVNLDFAVSDDGDNGILFTELELVTSKKKYKLESKLDSFLKAYNLFELDFGKIYTYNPRTDYFQGWDKKYIEFLRECNNLALKDSLDYKEKHLYSRIASDLDLSDRFFDILVEGNFLKLVNAPLKKILLINVLEKDDKNICINFQDLDDIIVIGRKTIAYLQIIPEKVVCLYRITEEEIYIIEELQSYFGSSEAIIISKTDLPLILPNLEKMGTLNIAEGLEDLFYSTKKKFSKKSTQ